MTSLSPQIHFPISLPLNLELSRNMMKYGNTSALQLSVCTIRLLRYISKGILICDSKHRVFSWPSIPHTISNILRISSAKWTLLCNCTSRPFFNCMMKHTSQSCHFNCRSLNIMKMIWILLTLLFHFHEYFIR